MSKIVSVHFGRYACLTMPDIFSAITELPKQIAAAIKSPRTGFVLVFVSGGLLIVSKWLPVTDNLILQKYHLWFVGSCLFGAAILLTSLFVRLYSVAQARYWVRKQLRSLLPDEKHILLGYISNKVCTRNLQLSNGVVASLRRKGLIDYGAQVGRYNEVALNISPYAYRYLNRHPELLKGAQEPGPDPFEVGNPFRAR